MAHKLLNLLIFILIVSVAYAKTNIHSDTNSSPFDFIKNLEGCRKGNNTKGINQLRTYLKRFGYITPLSNSKTQAADDNDHFDDILESAVKTYQANYKIKPTGIIDADTVSRMTAPRCGVPDIINGVNLMQPRKTSHGLNSSSIHAVSHYTYAGPKWKPSNRHLTYKFLGDFPEVAKFPAAVAFKRWTSVTHFTFSEVTGNGKSDLTLQFFRRDHGDGKPFDGRGGILAHAFFPTDGRLHYDLDELWFYLLKTKTAHDLWTVSLHEIGHLLGLAHSSVEAAVMWPIIRAGETKDLDKDDIDGIRTLYQYL